MIFVLVRVGLNRVISNLYFKYLIRLDLLIQLKSSAF
jgi:hypothetical protein